MLIISDIDIEHAESKLLPAGCSFDEERRAFIRSLDSCDVIACPGSGKTTALLAKLLILSRKMPFKEGGGICVLTHTNVAINEIKQKLGTEADTVIGYPNFFGTIQSFVDRFLAIPCFREEYGHRPQVIDNDRFMERLIAKCRANETIRKWIWANEKNSDYFTAEGALKSIRFNSEDLSLDMSKLFKKNTSPSYKAIHEVYTSVLKEGMLRYGHAYDLSLNYLIKHPSITRLLSERFRFVLVDEMQDTDSTQLEIINTVFSDDRTTIQKVGDPNQAIFSAPKDGEMEWVPDEKALTFSNSMRFGNSISRLIEPVRVVPAMALAGNPNVPSFPPHLIKYDDSNMTRVVSAFGSLIQQLELDLDSSIPNKVFKAVGWRRREQKEACIPLYWPAYKSKIKTIHRYSNLMSYIAAYQASACNSHSPSLFRALIYDALAQLGNKCLPVEVRSQRAFTANSFERWLKEKHDKVWKELNEEIAISLKELASGAATKQVYESLAGYIGSHDTLSNQLINPETGEPDLTRSEAVRFLAEDEIDPLCVIDDTCNTCDCSELLEIEVGTIHSVKGETHTATLLLESKYQRKHESEYLIPFLTGGKIPKRLGVHLPSCLKTSHVAMSRPTHLFAMACHKQRVEEHEKKLIESGWTVLAVSGLLKED